MVFKFFNILILLLLLLSCHNQRLISKQKKIINIAIPVNNKYLSLIYVALVSLFENSDKNTIYHIYIQIGAFFNKNNYKILFKLEQFYFNCFIHVIDMESDFYGIIKGNLDISTYYRLKLPILCPNLNRIIHIDADTIILKDLMELYTLNFEGKYILGRLDNLANELDQLGISTNTYINCGILLFDLYSLRKYNYVDKFMEYLNLHNNNVYLNHHDQTLINYVCHDKIGVLKPKFHMWPFKNKNELISTNNEFRIPYNEGEFLKDYFDPFIVHFPGYDKKNKYGFHRSIHLNNYNKYYYIAEEQIKNTKIWFFRKILNYLFYYINKIIF